MQTRCSKVIRELGGLLEGRRILEMFRKGKYLEDCWDIIPSKPLHLFEVVWVVPMIVFSLLVLQLALDSYCRHCKLILESKKWQSFFYQYFLLDWKADLIFLKLLPIRNQGCFFGLPLKSDLLLLLPQLLILLLLLFPFYLSSFFFASIDPLMVFVM